MMLTVNTGMSMLIPMMIKEYIDHCYLIRQVKNSNQLYDILDFVVFACACI